MSQNSADELRRNIRLIESNSIPKPNHEKKDFRSWFMYEILETSKLNESVVLSEAGLVTKLTRNAGKLFKKAETTNPKTVFSKIKKIGVKLDNKLGGESLKAYSSVQNRIEKLLRAGGPKAKIGVALGVAFLGVIASASGAEAGQIVNDEGLKAIANASKEMNLSLDGAFSALDAYLDKVSDKMNVSNPTDAQPSVSNPTDAQPNAPISTVDITNVSDEQRNEFIDKFRSLARDVDYRLPINIGEPDGKEWKEIISHGITPEQLVKFGKTIGKMSTLDSFFADVAASGKKGLIKYVK